MRNPFSASACAAAALILFAHFGLEGCASARKIIANDSKNGRLYAVATEKTSFYRYGPQQGNGPDETLPKDTLMTLIRPSFGYCKVQLVAGAKEGYVASEDIKPATPTLLAALQPPTPPPVSTSENFDMHSSAPPPLENLPAPDLPPMSPSPAPTP